MEEQLFDVIVIGGSNAGLSAAMSLGRSLRKVLIIDSGMPCNKQTPHSHNFLTRDGETPLAIATAAKQQVSKYETLRFLDGEATHAEKLGDQFLVSTKDGCKFKAKKLVLATGVKDLMPAIDGFSESWGISVIHCPYCHGYENKGKKTGLMANGERAAHLAPLVANLTNQLTIFTNGTADFTPEQLALFSKHQINLVEPEVAVIAHDKGYIKHIKLVDGTTHQLDALYAVIPFVQHSDIPSMLGCEMTEAGHIKVDAMQKTTVPGVFACGDNSSGMRSVALAVSAGNMAGALANMELAKEEFAIQGAP